MLFAGSSENGKQVRLLSNIRHNNILHWCIHIVRHTCSNAHSWMLLLFFLVLQRIGSNAAYFTQKLWASNRPRSWYLVLQKYLDSK